MTRSRSVAHLGDLKGILLSASFLLCKSFLGTFVSRNDFNRQEMRIEHTAPFPIDAGSTETTEVLRTRGSWLPGQDSNLRPSG